MHHEPKHLSKRDLAIWRRRRKVKKCLSIIAILLLAVVMVVEIFTNIFASKPTVEPVSPDPTTPPTATYKVDLKEIRDTLYGSDNQLFYSSKSSVLTIRSVNYAPQATSSAQVEKTEPKVSAYGPCEEYVYTLTYQDKVYIAKVVYKEARGEPFEGQVAVAAVILNRYVSDISYFSNDTIYDVVTQKNQFADISDVSEEQLMENPSCMEAVEAACKGWDPTREMFESGALYFFNPDGLDESQKECRKGIEVFIIEDHYFHVEFNTEVP